MDNQQKPDQEEKSGDSQRKQTSARPRRANDNRRRSNRGRSQPSAEPAITNEQPSPGDNQARKSRRPRSQRRPSETATPETAVQGTGTPSAESVSRQPRPGSRRRRRRPARRPEQPVLDSTSPKKGAPSSEQPDGQQRKPQPDSEASRPPKDIQSAGPGSKRRSPRGTRPEDGQVEAFFIPPEPVQDRKKTKTGSGRSFSSGKTSGNARTSQKPRQSSSDTETKSQPAHGINSRRGSSRRTSLSRRTGGRVFSPDRENESGEREYTGGQSTYVSLLGRFPARTAPSTPIRTDRGIKARSQRGAFSQNWWAGRWIESMEQLVDPARLQRGRSYARSGQVLSVQENPYGVEARVQGSRPAPYKVIIQLTPLTDDQWELVIDALAEQALFSAQLLAGEMPINIEEAFEKAGVSLFPKLAGDLFTSCSCPDWANPCKHVAATHYILADRFDDDPFLLFRMRGRSQEQILSDLNLRRGGLPDVTETVDEDSSPEEEVQPDIDDMLEHFWEPVDSLDTFPLTINPPRIDMPLLTRLGEPAFLPGLSLLNILRPVYSRFTYAALRAAYSEDEAVESNPTEVDQEQDHNASD